MILLHKFSSKRHHDDAWIKAVMQLGQEQKTAISQEKSEWPTSGFISIDISTIQPSFKYKLPYTCYGLESKWPPSLTMASKLLLQPEARTDTDQMASYITTCQL